MKSAAVPCLPGVGLKASPVKSLGSGLSPQRPSGSLLPSSPREPHTKLHTGRITHEGWAQKQEPALPPTDTPRGISTPWAQGVIYFLPSGGKASVPRDNRSDGKTCSPPLPSQGESRWDQSQETTQAMGDNLPRALSPTHTPAGDKQIPSQCWQGPPPSCP